MTASGPARTRQRHGRPLRPWESIRRELRLVLRGASPTHSRLRNRLGFLFVATLGLDVVATVLMYLFEHSRPDSGFDDLGGAFFWVSAQLTTVSSQMPNPVSTPGRILDILLEIWAVSVVATMAAVLASFLLTRHAEKQAAGELPKLPGPP